MARAHPDPTSAARQLTLDDWVQILNGDNEAATDPGGKSEAVTVLADALALRLAQELSQRIPPSRESSPTTRLLTLDQLVAELPAAKAPQTWERWLYERTRRGEIPGCVKLGGMLFFEREPALDWLRAGATTPN
jgi:hypothetical protein